MKLRPFIKVSKHRKFNYAPRYYDAVEDDLKMRSDQIERMNQSQRSEGQRIQFSGAFRSKSRTNHKPLIVMYMALLLATTIIGWLYVGNKIFYITFLLALPPYAFWKIRQYRSRRSD